MEIVKSSLPCTVLDVEYGVDKNGKPEISGDFVAVTVGSNDELYKSFYGNDSKIRLTYDRESASTVYVGREMYLNEVGYMFTSRDKETVSKLGIIPARHRSEILDKISAVENGQDNDCVRTYLYSNLSSVPDYDRPITRETVGDSYSRNIQSKVIKDTKLSQ